MKMIIIQIYTIITKLPIKNRYLTKVTTLKYVMFINDETRKSKQFIWDLNNNNLICFLFE